MYYKSLILSSLLFVTAHANEEKKEIVSQKIEENILTLEASLSNFNSKSEQYIYSQTSGRKISQLTWEADNVKLIGLEINYQVKNKIGLYLNYKTNINDGDGLMDDYDWLYSSSPNTWTNWSHHENTDVEKVNILDLGIRKDFDIYDNTILGLIIGYKWEKQLFKAYDGDFIYSTWPVLRDNRFSGNGLMVTYEQIYKGLYIGSDLKTSYKDFDFLLNVKYTPKMDVEFSDTHHQRTPSFTDYTSFPNTSMITFGLGVSYNFDKKQAFSLNYDYTKYSYQKGDRVRSFLIGTNTDLPNTVGIESKNNMITIAYKYTF